MCKIVHIVVCYYNEDEVVNFVQNEIMDQDLKPGEIIIVNNGTNDIEKINEISKIYPNVSVVGDGKNAGYWGAFLKALTRISFDTDYIILSNTDVKFLHNDFYNVLCDMLNSLTDDIAIIAPSIIAGSSRIDLNPYMLERPKLSQIKKLITIYRNTILAIIYNLLHVIKNKIFDKKRPKYLDNPNVFAPHGSFMIFRPIFMKTLNSYEYKAFLFGEEIFVGEICRRNNLKIKYIPKLKLKHMEHTTTGIFQTGRLLQYKIESLQFLYVFLKEWNK